jgi:Fe2+ or Zn2+ uptake regulation protein
MIPTVKLLEARIFIVCERCGIIGVFHKDQVYEAADCLENHMFDLPTHAVESAVMEVEV